MTAKTREQLRLNRQLRSKKRFIGHISVIIYQLSFEEKSVGSLAFDFDGWSVSSNLFKAQSQNQRPTLQ